MQAFMPNTWFMYDHRSYRNEAAIVRSKRLAMYVCIYSYIPQQHLTDMLTLYVTLQVLVLGGNGFVGQRVCQFAVSLGCEVVSLSRSGPPEPLPAWSDTVQWAQGDIFKPETYSPHLQGAAGVVSCVGAFGSNAFMERICGEATVIAAEAAAQHRVPHFVFISAAGAGSSSHLLLKGYYKGKQKAEDAVLRLFPKTGVCLRASAVHGDRSVKGMTVPLSVVMKPLASLLALPPFTALRRAGPLEAAFTAPVSVDNVGKTAALAALGRTPAGILMVEDINRIAEEGGA
jgi:uncharacterized protein YbjT (DUF2867 family)